MIALLSYFSPHLLLGYTHAPSIDVEGSFLPSWMLCLTVGSLLAVMVHRVILRRGLEDRIAPPLLFYPSLVVLVSCLVWLLFFR